MSIRSPGVTPDTVAAVALVAALEVPADALPIVAEMLQRQIAVLRDTRLLDAHEIEADIGFDPRWRGEVSTR